MNQTSTGGRRSSPPPWTLSRRYLWFWLALLLGGETVPESAAVAQADRSTRTGPTGASSSSAILVHVTTPPATLSTAYVQAESDVRRENRDRSITLRDGAGTLHVPWWRHRLTWNMTGSRLDVNEQIHFSLTHTVTSSIGPSPVTQCGRRPPEDPPGSLRLRHNTVLTLSPQYTLQAGGTTVRIDPNRSCSLPALAQDPMPVVISRLKSERERMTPLLTARLGETWPIRARLSQVWTLLEQPIMVDEPSKTWVMLHPRATRTGPLGLRDGHVAATVGVIVEPTLVRGTVQSPPGRPLPPAGGSAPPKGFHTTLEVPVSFQEGSERLRETLVGQQFGQGVGTITVQAARFAPLGDRAQVELDLDVAGVTSLTLQLTGKPVFDVPTQTVSFARFDYAVRNRSALAEFAESLLHEEFRRQLEMKLRIALGPRLEEIRRRLNEEFTREWKGGKVDGRVTTLRVLRLTMERTHFLASFLSEGELHYTVQALTGGAPAAAPQAR